MLKYGAWYGFFPSKHEQQALWDGGFDGPRVKKEIEKTIRLLSDRLKYYSDQFRDRYKVVETEKKKLKILQRDRDRMQSQIDSGADWTKKPDVNPEDIMKIFQKMIQEKKSDILNAISQAKPSRKFVEDYQQRLDSLRNGADKIGYMPKFNNDKEL